MEKWVVHEKYGKGIVLKTRYQGGEQLIRFTNGFEKWIQSSELKSIVISTPTDTNDSIGDIFDRKIDSISVPAVPRSLHSRKISISFCEPPHNKSEEYADIPAPNISLYPRSYKPVIILDEPFKTQITEQKDVVVAPDIPDMTNYSESNISFDEPIKNEITEQWNAVPINDIQFLDNSCNAFLQNKGNVSSRMIIEALRLGGVSHEQAEVFTYGRKKEIRNIKKWLMSEKGCLLISGEYGVGKTHLLEVISSMAIRDGWAVARIEIDPDESPLHKPKQIYNHFIKSLSYKQSDKILGFQDFITSIAESTNSERKERLLKHPYLGKVLTHWDDEEDRSWLLDWIKGDGSRPANFPQMYDTQTTANIYCNILSGLGWSAKNILGLKGIIILFDEAECVDAGWYTLYQFDKALRFLKGIILTSNNDESLLKDCTFCASGKLGLGYYGGSQTQYRYPYLWEHESCLKLIFSFVPDILDSMLNNKKIMDVVRELPLIKIDTLEEHDLQNILEKVIDVYENAYYDFTFNYDICDIYPYLSRNKTRTFLKGAVECLDIMRFNPEMQPNEIVDCAE